MRQSRKTSRAKRPRTSLLVRFFRWVSVCCLILLGVLIGAFGGLYYSITSLVPDRAGGLEYRPSDATRIYSSDGVMLARLFEENRDVVKLKDIPEVVQQATVAIEDKRFYQHKGVDPFGIARAIVVNIRGGAMEQGASTITQQLARNIYLSRRKTIARKLQEAVLALALERKFTKQQILEMYLNEVYYGSGAYGVEAAAQTYFGKPARELKLPEASLIAGLTQRPSFYTPFKNPKAALGRRKVVLQTMAGQGMITPAQADEAGGEPLRLVSKPVQRGWKAPYFVSYVVAQMEDEFGESNLYRAGLRIYTSLDYQMQMAAEEEVRQGVARNKSKLVGNAALVCVDPATGYIRAMVGGKDFRQSEFNVVTQGHPQAGSTFKVFVYSAALENGYSPNDTIVDERVWLQGRRRPPWPMNYDNRYSGRHTLRYMVAWSRNVPAVKLAQAVGIDEVIKFARLLGITADLPRDLTLALGSASVTPLEMARAYCAFANGGEAVKSIAVTKVTTADGSTLKEFKPVKRRVLSEQAAEGMDRMLREVVTRGTGTSVYRQVSEARGKTGTTDEDRHAWFIGYTPQLVTAVWVGNDRPIPMRSVWGGNVCAPIWSAFMRKAVPIQHNYIAKKAQADRQAVASTENTERREPRRRRSSSGAAQQQVSVNICDSSGLLATSACPSTHIETFNRGEAPSASCDMHQQAGQPEPEPQPPARAEPGQPPAARENPVRERPARAEPAREHAQEIRYVTLLICADTGNLANADCPHVVRRRFREDLAPVDVCTRH